MLEVVTHKYLKEFLIKYPSEWKHIQSFGRIISSFLRKEDNFLINSEIFLTDKWYAGALIPLFLNQEDSKLIISSDKIRDIIQNHLPLFKELGFNFIVKNNQLIFKKHKIWFLDFDNLVSEYKKSNFQNQNIIFGEVDNLQNDLNRNLRQTLDKKDWFNQIDKSLRNDELTKTYDLLKTKFFSKAVPNQKYIDLNINETFILKRIIFKYANFSYKFSSFKKAFESGWALWVVIDQDNFEWSLKAEPMDELNEIKDLFIKNEIIFLSSFRKDIFFQKYLGKYNIKIRSAINFKSCFNEKNILIYLPSRLLLPNNPLFVDSTFNKCIKFFNLSRGVSILLSDEISLKMTLATKLASIYGRRVLLENYPDFDNQIVCSSYDWWINNLHSISPPEQILIPLIPFPNMGEPLNQLKVFSIRSKSNNWFKEFMVPESFQKIEKAISPLRQNAGKLIFLDGRISHRGWGRDLLDMIKPQRKINYMFPFD